MEKNETPKEAVAVTVWELLLLWIIAALVGVIVGCPLARRHGVRQEIRNNWYVETIDSFRVTVTNDTIFMEIGGAK